MGHTKEPWSINKYGTVLADGHTLIVTGMGLSAGRLDPIAEANSRRIVACVNACAGIPTDDLEISPHMGLFHLAEFSNNVVQQRDELPEALKLILEHTEIPDRNCSCHISPPCNDCVDNSGIREAVEFAQADIAKATE